MANKVVTICASLIATACTIAAQAPALRATYAPNAHGPGFMISVTNVYTVPASEFIVEARYYLPVGAPCMPAAVDATARCTGGFERHSTPDFMPGTLLQPGVPRPLFAVGRVGEMIAATNLAVIYTDGQMAGDPALLRQMLIERAAYIADLQSAIPLLMASARESQPAPADLRAEFMRRKVAHAENLSAARSPGLPRNYGPSGDRACATVASMLGAIKPGQSSDQNAAALRRVARNIQIIIDNALASKPALTAVPIIGASR